MERIRYLDGDFDHIRRIVARTSGINLNASKRELVYSRLAKRVRRLGLASFSEYCRLLERDPGELGQCINAMTTNVTGFFRENHHFEYLRRVVFPEFVDRARRDAPNTLRMWSAGCSSGEEPYSIAITANEFFYDNPSWNVEINATDLDSGMLACARRGIYRAKDLENVDAARLRRFFSKGKGRNEGRARVATEIRDMVSFRLLNLKDRLPRQPAYDVIFCRNVMIYFDMELKKRLIEGFFHALRPGGYLFVGHSESLFGISDKFQVAGKTIHKRRLAVSDAA